MALLEAKVVDATHLQLSRPISVKRGRTVYVSVAESDEDRDAWQVGALTTLQAAYGDAEPAYSVSMIKESNTEYRA